MEDSLKKIQEINANQEKPSEIIIGGKPKSKLTDSERARIEKNRLRALHIKQAKLVSHPYSKLETNNLSDNAIIKVQGTRFVDSGGGFLIEESVLISNNDKNQKTESQTSSSISDLNSKPALETGEAIPIPIEYDECFECGDHFADSYLLNHFNYSVCDKCHDPDNKHSLITRTQAKEDYLLKDCDLDKREPILKFISRKNPHNIRWGEMKLYLLLQIEKRAIEVWGTEEELEKQREERVEKRTVTKIKKYNKQLKQLRMDVRSSLYDKTKSITHTHEFGPETYNEEDDTYTHSCLTCPYTETFEKM